ncbi:hypothetical protein LPB72_09700 [Hydrogenophaga crassostreae]|uniref:Replication protein-C C-terminal domain-containing protein n=2 Tax=Hydrogenophaga crassostreae TaxID=1763535 RepID=A0A163CE98_9BURK|nr:hypothetical protein LPB072_11085 [Hydrogenophaga crassostreae]OAD41598.1 hypothetical protein LPB72_09700 [Hydrogenophaga crassostreae]
MLAQCLGDFKAAIFLGHALYWSKHLAQVQPHRKGWFYMSATQWTVATGLSAREQSSVREALVERGLLLEALAGRPAVMHYKVELERTAQLLGLPSMAWDDMAKLFRSSIRFYKPLVDICGNVGAGLYLSYLLNRQSFVLRNPPQGNSIEMFPGEFTYRPEQARIALCLGIKAQRNARAKLKSAGFIREGRSSQETVSTRVNLMAIASCLQAQGERSIRKSAPRKHASPKALQDIALVKSSRGKAPPHRTAPLKRAGGTEANRQLKLFTPMGLIAQWSPTPQAEERLSPQDDAASLAEKSGAVSSAAGLVMSLFAPGKLATVHSGNSGAKFSTDSDTSGNRDALLSMSVCPFVDPNLPFCRNYIEQGISSYFQTTTTTQASVDSRDSENSSRRRVGNSGKSKDPDAETATENGIDAERSVVQSSALVSHLARQADVAQAKCQALIPPSGLDPLTQASVLSTVAKAPKELRQSFLDELAGHLSIPSKLIHNPAGWLHGLIRNHGEGFVVLAMAPQIAAQRAKRQQHQDRLTNAVPVPAAGANLATSKVEEDSEIKRATLQRLRELKVSFAANKEQRK